MYFWAVDHMLQNNKMWKLARSQWLLSSYWWLVRIWELPTDRSVLVCAKIKHCHSPVPRYSCKHSAGSGSGQHQHKHPHHHHPPPHPHHHHQQYQLSEKDFTLNKEPTRHHQHKSRGQIYNRNQVIGGWGLTNQPYTTLTQEFGGPCATATHCILRHSWGKRFLIHWGQHKSPIKDHLKKTFGWKGFHVMVFTGVTWAR